MGIVVLNYSSAEVVRKSHAFGSADLEGRPRHHYYTLEVIHKVYWDMPETHCDIAHVAITKKGNTAVHCFARALMMNEYLVYSDMDRTALQTFRRERQVWLNDSVLWSGSGNRRLYYELRGFVRKIETG